MDFYLPIAETNASGWLLLALGGAVGFLSGMFGVGGGFLITPLLILLGIPSAVAVGTGAAQVVASSVSGTIAQYRRNNVDMKMGLVLIMGGVAGAAIGVELVKLLRGIGQFDLVVSITYVVFLGTIGLLMLMESLAAMRRVRKGASEAPPRRTHRRWIQKLPFRVRFPRSRLYISTLPPLGIGFCVGLLAAIMGVGGGFVMVPALIYLLRMPTMVVIGTSLFQIGFVTAATTILHATRNHNVDIVLALLLMTGAAAGTEAGAAAGQKLKGEQLRFLLAGLVLLVAGRIAFDLLLPPSDAFSLTFAQGV